MRATIILAPHVHRRHLEPYRSEGVEFSENAISSADVAIIFGGDGTVHRHLAELSSASTPLLTVPVGSGNDFAGSLGLTSPEIALEAWRKFCAGTGTLWEIDLGMIEAGPPSPQALPGSPATYFCVVAGLGLDSEANRRANLMPPWLRRRGGYVLAALLAVIACQPVEISARPYPATNSDLPEVEPVKNFGGSTLSGLTQDGSARGFAQQDAAEHDKSVAGPAWFIAIANSPQYGDGMRIAPAAKLDDGLLDVCFVGRTSKAKLLRNLPRVFSGDHIRLPEVTSFACRGLCVESDHPMPVYADGEFVAFTPVAIRVLPKALRVIAP